VTQNRWEYARVAWLAERRKIKRTDPECRMLSDEIRAEWDTKAWAFYWWHEHFIWITMPNAMPEKRLSWKTGDEVANPSVLAVLNEMGQRGWEVVTSGVAANAMTTHQGWEPTGYPIQWSYMLKRLIAGAGKPDTP
jgi:hypothetical protein